jgi:acetate kinase
MNPTINPPLAAQRPDPDIEDDCTSLSIAAYEAFAFLGLKLDPEKNAQFRLDCTAPDSTVRVLVIHTEEDWELARECRKLAHD